MSVDRLSNMVSSLKNTALSKKGWVEIYHSNECESVAKVLKAKGFIEDIKVFKPKGNFLVKMFNNDKMKKFVGDVGKKFGYVYVFKPKVSKKRSKEIYIIAKLKFQS